MNGIIENVFRRKQGDRTYYYGALKSSQAKTVTFVPVLEHSPRSYLIEMSKDGNEDGYQRPGSLARMNKFKAFLVSNPHSLVPPVILSGRKRWAFKSSEYNENIGFLQVGGPAAIIDGQHRLGGYVALFESESTDREIDFLLIDDLSREEEIAEFFIINNSQVGVPKSLGVFIGMDNQYLSHLKNRIEDQYIFVAWGLNTSPDSPFNGRITRTKLSSEHLFALASVAQHIEKMYNNGVLVDLDQQKKLEIAIKYWNLIQDAHPEQFEDIAKLGIQGQGKKAFEFKLLELTGFIAWSQLGGQILSQALNVVTGEMNWDEVQEKIEYLANKIDWRKDGQYKNATGVVGGPIIRLDMEKVLANMKV